MNPIARPRRLNDQEIKVLVVAAGCGDAGAKRALVERTLPVVHGMMAKLVGRRQELDDLVQNVYMRVFRSLGTFRGDAAFTTWVCTICVNVAHTFWREKKSELETEPVPLHLVRPGSNADELTLAREGLRQVATMLDAMSPALRFAFVLHVFEGHDIEAVAAMTSSSVAATYKAIERARHHIEAAAKKNPSLAHYLGESQDAS